MKGVLTMKKVYETPRINRIIFECEDLITLSIPEFGTEGIEDNGAIG